MNKRMLSIILSLCLVIAIFMSVPVFASGSISINKTEFTANEKGRITVTGLTQQEIDDGAYLTIDKKGTRPENAAMEVYVSDLPTDNVYEFTAPYNIGTYEIFLMDLNYNVIDKKEFFVGAPKAQPGDITLSKTEVKLNEPMSVTVKGLTDGQISNYAWIGIEKWNEKIENTAVDAYISDLPMDNTYKFNAPQRFGKYEVRVFSDGSDKLEASFFGKSEFLVVSSKAQPGDILLSKTSVSPDEKMSVTVNGLTQGEIETGAWLGIAASNEKLENTGVNAYISDLPVGNSYEFTAPSTPGTYEVRVFCASNLENEEFEYGKFGVAQFIVSGTAAPSTEIPAGYEGLSGWAASEVNQAADESLVTDKVMVDFPAEITREEFCELAVLLYEKMTGNKATPVAVNPFSDTNNPEILKAYNLKIVGGIGEGKFAPKNKVTRQEISAMLLRALKVAMPNIVTTAEFRTKFQDESDIASWALEAVKFMNANEIVKGSTVNGVSYILPKGNTTKEQAILLVLRVYNAFYKI